MSRILLASIFLLAGCSFSPSADVIKALAGDPNSICFTESSIYVSFSLDRNHGCDKVNAPVVVVGPSSPAPTIIRP